MKPPTDAPASEANEKAQYRDLEKVRALVKRCIDDASRNTARRDRDRQDWKNLLFERGGSDNQWVIWDQQQGRYVPRSTDPNDGGLPAYVPRPVTNIYAKQIDGISGLLNQSEPALQYAPGSDDEDDRAAADVCEDAVPVLREECGYDRGDRERLNRLSVLTNAAAYAVFYDDDPRHGSEEMECYRCNACGADGLMAADVEDAEMTCPECGEEALAEDEVLESGETIPRGLGLSVGPTGAPNLREVAIGKVCGDIAPSFEFSVPSSARTMDSARLPWVLMHTRMSPEDVEARWPKAKGVARDRSQWAGQFGVQRQYADHMRKLSSPLSSMMASGSNDELDGPIVYRLFHDPIDTEEFCFPEGLYAVCINDEVFDAVPLPVVDDQGKPVKNVVIRQFTPSVVSAHGKPPADDLVPIQESRNLVEALIDLSLMHDAAPTTFLPETVTLIDELSGAPGATVRYRSLDGQRPVRERGVGPSESLYKQLELLDQKADEISKLNAVLAGARPEGDPTLGEIQILQERGMQAFREPVQALIRFETDLARMLLWIAKLSLWSPRIRKIRGENGQWEVRKFAKADLAGHVDIECEVASAWPKSPLMQQLKLKDAVSLGLINPQADAEVAMKVLNSMGLTEMKPSLSVDLKHIARELDRWKQAKTPQDITPPDPVVWNLDLHLQFKKQFLKSEEAEDLKIANRPVHQAMTMHVQALEQALMQKQMQAAAAAAGPQPGGPPSGDALAQAVQSGVLTPAGAQAPPEDPMQAALAGGLLTPAGAVPEQPAGPSIDDLLEAKLLEPVSANDPRVTGEPPL
ncbi:MAG: zinc ribbon domain-containing protein [Acidobacteria bacterium]|nr:zinc ribbon domain-containing protein [Acidobacteriota bacterium]